MNTLNPSELRVSSDVGDKGDNHVIDHGHGEILELSLDEMAYVAGGAQSYLKYWKIT